MANQLPHGKIKVKGNFTIGEIFSCYHPVMDKTDAEINEILLYIAERIDALTDDIGKRVFAIKLGLKSSKNFNDFLRYAHEIKEENKLPNPKLRTVYRLLRGFLGRSPINLNKPEFKGEKARIFNQFMEIILESILIDEGKSYETLKDMIDFMYHKFSEIKKQTIKKRG